MLMTSSVLRQLHIKCRNTGIPYLHSTAFRVLVPDEKVDWAVEWKEYAPTQYTSPSLNGKPWADPDSPKGLVFNKLDVGVDRNSFEGPYSLSPTGLPLNPRGRTGMAGRGLLGRWGPNHAADPVVSRRTQAGKLQWVAIKRGDTGEWAIPGGMVDPGEEVSATLKREFTEEALAGVDHDHLEEFWSTGVRLYAGYVDDPRNTDNAWMETVVVNFHDDEGILENCNFQAGDDAKEVRWVDADDDLPLYASHRHFIELFRERLKK